jgi:hypothetical protein
VTEVIDVGYDNTRHNSHDSSQHGWLWFWAKQHGVSFIPLRQCVNIGSVRQGVLHTNTIGLVSDQLAGVGWLLRSAVASWLGLRGCTSVSDAKR